jgi:hypothetical protein
VAVLTPASKCPPDEDERGERSERGEKWEGKRRELE